jgi:hypothetical protein
LARKLTSSGAGKVLDSEPGEERRHENLRRRFGLSTAFEGRRAIVVTGALRGFDFPTCGLVLLGVFVNFFSREEVYANLEYGFPMLALFGAAGCIGQLTVSISRHSGTLASACCIPTRVLRATFFRDSIRSTTSDLPVLLALLFGPFVVLLAGLGGWV